MNTYFRLMGFARPIGKYAVPYFACTLLHAVFNAFSFVMIIPILETLFDSSGMVEFVTEKPEFALKISYLKEFINYQLFKTYGENYDVIQVLYIVAAIVVTSSFFSNLFRYLGARVMENMRIQTLFRLRNDAYNNVMHLNVSYFSNERKGDIISKITSDVAVVQFCITNTLQVAFREPFLILSYMFAMVLISWKLTIFAALFLPCVAFIIGTLVKKLKRKATMAQQTNADMVSTLDESLMGIKIIKAYNAVDYIIAKYYAINRKLARLSRSMSRRQQLASPISEFLGITAAAVLLIYGGTLVLADGLSAAGFIAYLGIFSQITRPVRAFTDSFATINQGIAAGERVLALMDTKPEIVDKPDAISLDEFREAIEFRDVEFNYGSRDIIKGISFRIKKGETVALVGPSGGGKSTISDLIPRFYEVQKGEILIDGVNLKDYKVDSVRAHMGMVAQETILFNDTIENNIRMGKQDATIEEIVAAAKVANALDFIMESDNGFQTNIGDRGIKLSGGQRQRLSIARAVLKNPDILILDEATSALDTESEKLVQDALEKLLRGRTSVVIAHRLSTISHADKIIVIEEGRIAEEGTHAELIARNGIYCRLVEMQQMK